MASEASPAEGGAPVPEAPVAAPVAAPALMPAPRGLRAGRAFAGVLLLTLAWGVVMGAFLLLSATLATPLSHGIATRLALYAAGIIVALWLAIMALGAIIAGAFCLMLAVTSRQW
ncbi:MAG TPA: hypothetical protein VGR57_15430 [Ktedonobacterales bacterium]|nr:hypothetical protein [Ktedonobacterales bacterium]